MAFSPISLPGLTDVLMSPFCDRGMLHLPLKEWAEAIGVVHVCRLEASSDENQSFLKQGGLTGRQGQIHSSMLTKEAV